MFFHYLYGLINLKKLLEVKDNVINIMGLILMMIKVMMIIMVEILKSEEIDNFKMHLNS